MFSLHSKYFEICFLMVRFWDMYSYALALHVSHVNSCTCVCSCVRVQNIFMVAEHWKARLRRTCRFVVCCVCVAQALSVSFA